MLLRRWESKTFGAPCVGVLRCYLEQYMPSFRFNPFHGERSEKGATMVEYSIILPLFFVLVLTTFDLLRLGFNALSIEYVGARVMRLAALGPPSPLPPSYTTFEKYLEDEMITLGAPLGLRLKHEDISFCPIGMAPCGSDNAGKPRDLVVTRLRVPVNGYVIGEAMRLAKTTYFLGTTLITKNEPR